MVANDALMSAAHCACKIVAVLTLETLELIGLESGLWPANRKTFRTPAVTLT